LNGVLAVTAIMFVSTALMVSRLFSAVIVVYTDPRSALALWVMSRRTCQYWSARSRLKKSPQPMKTA
jgi:hypothetical protein